MKYLTVFILYFLFVPVAHGDEGMESDVVEEACIAMKKQIAYLSCVEQGSENCPFVDQHLMGNPIMIELGEVAVLCFFDLEGYCLPEEETDLCKNRHNIEVTKCIKKQVESTRKILCSSSPTHAFI